MKAMIGLCVSCFILVFFFSHCKLIWSATGEDVGLKFLIVIGVGFLFLIFLGSALASLCNAVYKGEKTPEQKRRNAYLIYKQECGHELTWEEAQQCDTFIRQWRRK